MATRKRQQKPMKQIQETIQRNLVLTSIIFGLIGSCYGGYQVVYSKGADAAVEKITPRIVVIENDVKWLKSAQMESRVREQSKQDCYVIADHKK